MFFFFLIGWVSHPHTPSDPATKEYVDGGKFFNYKRKLLSSDYFAKDKYTNSFTMPSESEIGNEFNGLYAEFEFVNYQSRDNTSFIITLLNSSSSEGLNLFIGNFSNNDTVNLKTKNVLYGASEKIHIMTHYFSTGVFLGFLSSNTIYFGMDARMHTSGIISTGTLNYSLYCF